MEDGGPLAYGSSAMARRWVGVRQWGRRRWLMATPAACLAAGTGLILATALGAGGASRASPASATEPATFAAFALQVANDGTPEPPTPTPTATPTPTPPPRPTSPAGLRVWADGDSTSYFMSYWFLALTSMAGAVQVQPAAEYKISSGLLTGPTDWPQKIAEDMAVYQPDLVVFMLGANDAVLNPDPERWRERVGAVMDQFHETADWVVWVGEPIMGPNRPDLNRALPGMNQVVAEEAAKRPWAIYVDTWDLMADTSGAYAQSLPDSGGVVVVLRADDGVHFSSAGGRRLAEAVIAAVFR